MGTFCTACSSNEGEKEKSFSNNDSINKRETSEYDMKNEMYYKKSKDYENNIVPFLKIKRSVSLRDSKYYQNGNVSVINI